jgi:hypothetical protein
MGLPDRTVAEPGHDNNITGLAALKVGESDYWWVTGRWIGVGKSVDDNLAGIRFDSQGRAQRFMSGNRFGPQPQ